MSASGSTSASTSSERFVWSTAGLLGEAGADAKPLALIILNTPLPNARLFDKLWDAAAVRYCADGGANRLYTFIQNNNSAYNERPLEVPDLIKGDLDSLKPRVRAYFEEQGVSIVHDPDQYSTDLGKCCVAVAELEERTGKAHDIVIVGGLSGRLDQTIHTVHALIQLAETRGNTTWVVGKESLACVLTKGKHDLTISKEYFGDTCAVLPIGQEARVTTTGQQWNLGPTEYMYPTSVAKCVSSSNHLETGRVTVETDVPVVWTVEVRDRDDEDSSD